MGGGATRSHRCLQPLRRRGPVPGEAVPPDAGVSPRRGPCWKQVLNGAEGADLVLMAVTVPSGHDYLSRGPRSDSDFGKGHSAPGVGRDRGSPCRTRRLDWGQLSDDCARDATGPLARRPRGVIRSIRLAGGPSFEALTWPHALAPRPVCPEGSARGRTLAGAELWDRRAVHSVFLEGRRCRSAHGGSSSPPPPAPRTRSYGSAHPAGAPAQPKISLCFRPCLEFKIFNFSMRKALAGEASPFWFRSVEDSQRLAPRSHV